MTQIRHLTQPHARRPGELGVHSLDRFHFAVPDLEAARKFYGNFGLDVRAEGNAIHLHTHGHPHRWGSVAEGPKKKLQFISFGAYEDDLPTLPRAARSARHSAHRSAARVGVERPVVPRPDGTPIEIRVAEKCTPDEKSAHRECLFIGRRRRCAEPQQAAAGAAAAACAYAGVHPRHPEGDQVLQRGAGLRLSDRSGDMIAFMHAIHGSDHHVIAFVKSEGPGLHHLSWDVARSTTSARARCRWRTRVTPRLGAWPPRAGLELFPLRARPVGQLRRVFLRRRLHPGRSRLEGW